MTTGISAHDRAQTILAAVDPDSSPDDFGRPDMSSRFALALAASWSGGARRRRRSISLGSPACIQRA